MYELDGDEEPLEPEPELELGILRTRPTLMLFAFVIPLSEQRTETVVPCLAAISESVSPRLTV